MANWDTLREGNIARNKEWTLGASIEDFTWRGCELGGEVGEVAELLMSGRDLRTPDFAEELADVVICIDLTALTLGLPEIPRFARGSFPIQGRYRAAADLLLPTGRLLNILKKLERERRGWVGSRSTVEEAGHCLEWLNGLLGCYAQYVGVHLTAAVVDKFNATSNKVGLVTRLNPVGGWV